MAKLKEETNTHIIRWGYLSFLSDPYRITVTPVNKVY